MPIGWILLQLFKHKIPWHKGIPEDLVDCIPTLIKVIACCKVTSNRLNQCWLRSPTPYVADVVTNEQNALNILIINTLGSRQHTRCFVDDIFECIFFNENYCILIKISLNYDRKGPIDNNPALVQIMAWRRPGDKSSGPMMVRLPTHVWVTRPQWVN